MRDQLVDAGFADTQAARAILRRLKMRAVLDDTRASAEALLDLLSQRGEADCDAVSALIDEARKLAACDTGASPGENAVASVGDKEMREKELLEGVKLILDLLDAVCVGIRHGLFSDDNFADRMARGESRHSLSGGGK